MKKNPVFPAARPWANAALAAALVLPALPGIVGEARASSHMDAPLITLDDAAIADSIFATLMGDDVELRRNFIQQNAKDVRFLDI